MVDIAGVAEDAAKGAAMGSVVPGIGTVVGAVGGAALGLIGDSDVSKWLFGSKGAAVAQKAVAAVQSVTGTADPAGQDAALAKDPQLAVQLKLQLAQIAAQQDAAARQEELATLQARLKDVQDARAQQLGLAKAGSRVQWAPAIVSVVVLATFALVMWAALTRQLPPGSETILNVLMGMLGAGFTAVLNFWLGSSSDSHRKTDLLFQSSPPPGA